jgi:hypothetical protein
LAAPQAHRAQALANLSLARQLLDLPDPSAHQWAVTIAFYCSVHALESHLTSSGQPARSHYDRYRKLLGSHVPQEIVVAHRELQLWSEQARYLMREFSVDFVRDYVLDGDLQTVLAFVGMADRPTPQAG